MAISKIFKLAQVVTPSGAINQCQSVEINPGLETVLHCGDGVVDYSYAAVMFQSPVMRFTTTALARALAIAGISGLSIESACDFYLQQADQGGTRKTGNTALKLTGTKGILVPTTVTATDRGIAEVRFEAALISTDGSTAPLASTADQALPAVTLVDQLFTVGPVSINGSAVEGVKSITWDLGLRLGIEGGDGEAYPTFAFIDKRRPTITVRTTRADAQAVLGGWFTAQGATDSAVWFRKLAENGLRVANGTAEHIKLGMDDGLITTRPATAEDEGAAMGEILLEPTWDGTNDVVALSTGAAIS